MIIDDMSISKLERPAVLEKGDGSRISIMAEIQSEIAFISDIDTPIEVDDIIERTRGKIADRFIVTDILLCEEDDGLIEPHIQAKIV